MCLHVGALGASHGCMGLGCDQESFLIMHGASGVMTNVQKDWEGAGRIGDKWCCNNITVFSHKSPSLSNVWRASTTSTTSMT